MAEAAPAAQQAIKLHGRAAGGTDGLAGQQHDDAERALDADGHACPTRGSTPLARHSVIHCSATRAQLQPALRSRADVPSVA